MTGAPVVCTDVGASLRVLTDPSDGSRYSEVVAPNDPLSLARAQITLLALLGEWSKYADDPEGYQVPVLTDHPTSANVACITQRMYEKSKQRRKLGMMTRAIVQQSFRGDRYLREHEQMLWIGKATYEMREKRVKPIGISIIHESKAVSIPTDYFNAVPVTPEARQRVQSSHSIRSLETLPGLTDSWASYPASLDFHSIVTPKANSLLNSPRRMLQSRPSSRLSDLRLSNLREDHMNIEADAGRISSPIQSSEVMHLARPIASKRVAPIFTALSVEDVQSGHSRSSSQTSTPGEISQASILMLDINVAERKGLVNDGVAVGFKGERVEKAPETNFASRMAAQGWRSSGWD